MTREGEWVIRCFKGYQILCIYLRYSLEVNRKWFFNIIEKVYPDKKVFSWWIWMKIDQVWSTRLCWFHLRSPLSVNLSVLRGAPQTPHSRRCHVVWSPHHPGESLASPTGNSPLSKYCAPVSPREASIFNEDIRLDANCYESLVVCFHQEYGYSRTQNFLNDSCESHT